MSFFFFFTAAIGSSASFFVLHFGIAIISRWQKARWLQQNGIEAAAQILKIEVINEPGRYLPFLKLKVAVLPSKGAGFIASVDSFFPPHELLHTVINGSMTIRYNPYNISEVQIVKRLHPVKEEKLLQWEPVSTKAYLSMMQ